ncbi:MAG: flagellar biosynthetic protein FliO [Terriglobales bacterium]
MKSQPANRTSALLVPYPSRPTPELPLRIVPATAGTEAEVKAPAKRGNKTQPHKARASKKPARKNKLARKKKTTAIVAAKSRNGACNGTEKLLFPAVMHVSSRLMPPKENSALRSDAEMTRNTNADFDGPVASALITPENPLTEPATLACGKISLYRDAEEVHTAAESDDLVEHEMIEVPIPAPATEEQSFLKALALQWTSFLGILTRTWTWTQQKLRSHGERKRLRVCETVSLGEKRFIAVIQVDGKQFLVGGSSNSVSTLAHLEPPPEFADLLHRCEQGVSQA